MAPLPEFVVPPGRLELRRYPQGSVAFVFEKGSAFEVDEAGSRILALLNCRHTVTSVASILSHEYGVDQDTVTEDIAAFLRECVNLGVVELLPNSPTVPQDT